MNVLLLISVVVFIVLFCVSVLLLLDMRLVSESIAQTVKNMFFALVLLSPLFLVTYIVWHLISRTQL